MQAKLGHKTVREIQLGQDFDVTAGVNADGPEELRQGVGHQVVGPSDQSGIVEPDGSVEIEGDVVDVIVWDVLNNQNIRSEDASSEHQEAIHVFPVDIDVSTKESTVSREIHQPSNITRGVDLSIGCNDEAAGAGSHERASSAALVGNINRASGGQLKEFAGVQGHQSSG